MERGPQRRYQGERPKQLGGLPHEREWPESEQADLYQRL